MSVNLFDGTIEIGGSNDFFAHELFPIMGDAIVRLSEDVRNLKREEQTYQVPKSLALSLLVYHHDRPGLYRTARATAWRRRGPRGCRCGRNGGRSLPGKIAQILQGRHRWEGLLSRILPESDCVYNSNRGEMARKAGRRPRSIRNAHQPRPGFLCVWHDRWKKRVFVN